MVSTLMAQSTLGGTALEQQPVEALRVAQGSHFGKEFQGSMERCLEARPRFQALDPTGSSIGGGPERGTQNAGSRAESPPDWG